MSQLPAALVLVSLVSLALVPVMSHRLTNAAHADIGAVAEPARRLVAEIQSALALESAASRGYLLTGDLEVAGHHAEARTRRDAAIARLRVLGDSLSPAVQREVAAVMAVMQRTEPLLDSLFGGSLTRTAYMTRLPLQQQRLQEVLSATVALDRAIGDDVQRMLDRVESIDTRATIAMVGLVLLALVAAFLVARLARGLRDSEARFRQIAEAIDDFIWLRDAAGRPLYVNAAYERIWGRDRQTLTADPPSLLDGVHPDDRDRVASILRSPQQVYSIEFRVVRPDGSTRHVWSRGFPVRNELGQVYRIASITEDVTDRRASAESRSRLLRGFTHDVKNPLGAADGFLALLDDGIYGPLADEQRTGVERARRSIRSALDLVTHMLDLARAEAGQLQVDRARMDLGQVVAEVVEEFRGEAEARRHSLAVSVPSAGHQDAVVIHSDRARVRQILANLIANAIKYTPEGGRIAVTTGIENNDGDRTWACVSVSDTGPGIAAEHLQRLFSEFTRFDRTTTGSGIGLAISQRIAVALAGEITVTSRVGEGSTFTLRLPSR